MDNLQGQIVAKLSGTFQTSTLRSLRDRKRAVRVSPSPVSDMVEVSTEKSKKHLVYAGNVSYYKIGDRIANNSELALYSESPRSRHVVVRKPLYIVAGGIGYIVDSFEFDASDNTYRVGYGDTYTGWQNSFIGPMLYALEEVNSNEVSTVNIQSPNKGKKFKGHDVTVLSDPTILDLMSALQGYLKLVESTTISREQLLKFSPYTEDDLDKGMELLKSELEFRMQREDLAEQARLEAELEALKSREEKQREAQAKLAEVKARLGQKGANK
jgi:hypothetical protein